MSPLAIEAARLASIAMEFALAETPANCQALRRAIKEMQAIFDDKAESPSEVETTPLYEANLELATLEAKNQELAKLLRESDLLISNILGDYTGEFQKRALKHTKRVGLFFQTHRY